MNPIDSEDRIFKAGKYYVGDPCYVIEDWDSIIESTGCFGLDDKPKPKNWNDGLFYLMSKKCFADGTAYGDGTYLDNYGNIYHVDAGLIGIMPVEAMTENQEGKGGQIIEFKEDFQVKASFGVFVFGHIIINTRDQGEEDND